MYLYMKRYSKNLVALLSLLLCAHVFAADKIKMEDQTQIPAAPNKLSGVKYFSPPEDADLQNNAFGDLVRKGEALFVNTKALAPLNVGNEMNCVNCHLDRGRKANSSPMWGGGRNALAMRLSTSIVSIALQTPGLWTLALKQISPAIFRSADRST